MSLPRIKLLAGDFPPTLNTASADTDLQPNETPDSYGFDLLADGKIKKGTVPTGTARVEKSVTLTEGALSVPYLWHGNRLWNITNRTASTASNILTYGALNYQDVFYPSNTSFYKRFFNEDAQTILAILPIEPDSLLIIKTTGSYVIRNISDTRGFFQVSDLIQPMAAGAANRCAVVNNVAFVGNATDGVIGYENYKTVEATRKLRPERATIGALAMTADFERQWLILGSTYVYDVANDKWFNYSGSGFRFTSRRVRNPDWTPFSVQRLIFAIEHGDTTNGTLKYQVRHDKSTWSKTYTVNLPYTQEKYVTVSEGLELQNSSTKWQMRVTSLSSGKYIRNIMMEAEDLTQDDYGE